MMDIFIIISGLAFLYLGGEGLVRGSVEIAEKLKLSNLLIGTVVIGFGTSMPEMLVSIDAALRGYPEITLGNIVGSNISNILLVLGLAAVITLIPCNTIQIRRDACAGVAAATVLVLLSLVGYITRYIGLAMVAILVSYLYFIITNESYLTTKKHEKLEEKIEEQFEAKLTYKKMSTTSVVCITVFSLMMLMIGSRLLVSGAVSLANNLGLSKAVIGLTFVAVGTSLPEIVTACIASWHKNTDMIIGNILGSNLFNILSIVGITALIKPIPFAGQIAKQDVWIMLGASVLLSGMILVSKKIGRVQGVIFLVLYVVYLLSLYL